MRSDGGRAAMDLAATYGERREADLESAARSRGRLTAGDDDVVDAWSAAMWTGGGHMTVVVLGSPSSPFDYPTQDYGTAVGEEASAARASSRLSGPTPARHRCEVGDFLRRTVGGSASRA